MFVCVVLLLVIVFLILIRLLDNKKNKSHEGYWSCKTVGNTRLCEDNVDDEGQHYGLLGSRVIN